MRPIMLPQALRVIIPPMTNQFVKPTKNSSLTVAIGYPTGQSSSAKAKVDQPLDQRPNLRDHVTPGLTAA